MCRQSIPFGPRKPQVQFWQSWAVTPLSGEASCLQQCSSAQGDPKGSRVAGSKGAPGETRLGDELLGFDLLCSPSVQGEQKDLLFTCFFLLPLLSPCQSLSSWAQWEPLFGKAQEQGESCFSDRSSWCRSGLRSCSLPPAPLPAAPGRTALLSVCSSCWDWSTAVEGGPWEWGEAEASA